MRSSGWGKTSASWPQSWSTASSRSCRRSPSVSSPRRRCVADDPRGASRRGRLRLVAALGFDGGGYAPPAWGWSSVVLFAVLAVLIARGVGRPRPAALVLVGALAGLAAWAAVSILWSNHPSASILDVQRTVLYVGAASLFVLARPGPACPRGCSGGRAARCSGLTSVEDGIRLAEPIGYANGMAILAVLGLLIAAGFAARASGRRSRPRRRDRADAGRDALLHVRPWSLARARRRPARRRRGRAGTAPARGDRARARGPGGAGRARRRSPRSVRLVHRPARSPVRALRPGPLRRCGSRPPCIARRGRLARVCGSARRGPGRRRRRRAGEGRRAEGAYDAFKSTPSPTHGELSGRVFSLFRQQPRRLLGGRLGELRGPPRARSRRRTYARTWLRERPVPQPVVDAHSLYLEVLLRAGAVRPRPCSSWPWRRPGRSEDALDARRARSLRGVPRPRRPGLGLGAAGGDRRGARLRNGTRRRPDLRTATAGRRRPSRRSLRPRGLAFLGNQAVERSVEASNRLDWSEAEDAARRARTLQPWSPQPWRLLGEIELAEGSLSAARRYFRQGLREDRDDWELWIGLASPAKGRPLRRHSPRSTA